MNRARTAQNTTCFVDPTGIPLAVSSTGGSRHDVTQPMPLHDAFHARPIAGKIGRAPAPRA